MPSHHCVLVQNSQPTGSSDGGASQHHIQVSYTPACAREAPGSNGRHKNWLITCCPTAQKLRNFESTACARRMLTPLPASLPTRKPELAPLPTRSRHSRCGDEGVNVSCTAGQEENTLIHTQIIARYVTIKLNCMVCKLEREHGPHNHSKLRLCYMLKGPEEDACRPRVAILGSRQQLCLHPTVSTLSGGAANQACRGVVASKDCSW